MKDFDTISYLNVETEETAARRETKNDEEELEIDNDNSHAGYAGMYCYIHYLYFINFIFIIKHCKK